MSYEWVTVFTVRHDAGSEEGAIHQRNVMDAAIRALGGDVRGASTTHGNASATALDLFMAAAEVEAAETEDDDEL